MAYGDITLFTVGYTNTDAASVRKNYPIKRKYKQTESTQTPKFPSSYTQVSAQQYWMPFLSLSSSDNNYIPYTTGDEYGWSDDNATRARQIPYSNPKTVKYNDYPIDIKIVYANEIYVATRYTFEWTSTKFEYDKNPYKSTYVRKWRKYTDTSDTWTQYWYHPLLKRFIALEATDTLLELPDFDEPSQSRWDSFVGDAKEMNLNTFTFAQIQELISQGIPGSTAEAEVSSLNVRQAGADLPTVNVPQNTTTPQSGTFIVNTQSSPETGASASSQDNLPKMIQRITTGAPGVKTIIDTYVFNLRPNNVQYSNIGVTWTEVDRVNNHALVEYRNNKLMRITFEFVVEAQIIGISSLFESCEDRLNQLSRMANRPELVTFTNFDSLFTDAKIYGADQSNYREWAIAELSINSVQRTPAGANSESGAISRATVNMTIQEVRLNRDQVIFMPKLRKVPGVPNVPPPTNEPEPCIELATDSVASSLPAVKYSPCWYKFRGMTPPGG